MNKIREAFEKYSKSRQEMMAYHGGTCNQHDFEAGYQAAIAAVKAGGIALEVVNEWVDHGDYDQGNELVCKPLKKLALGDRLYKLLEDE